MAIQLQSHRHKRGRVYMYQLPVDKLTQLANATGSGTGKQRQKARNELVRRGLSW